MEIADWIDRLFAARTGPAVAAAVVADLPSLDRRIAVAVPLPHSGGGRGSEWIVPAAWSRRRIASAGALPAPGGGRGSETTLRDQAVLIGARLASAIAAENCRSAASGMMIDPYRSLICRK